MSNLVWVKQTKCDLPKLSNDDRLGDVWKCDECGKLWKISQYYKFERANILNRVRYSNFIGRFIDKFNDWWY